VRAATSRGTVIAPHSVAPTKAEENIFLKSFGGDRPPKSVYNAKASGTTANSDNPFLDGRTDTVSGSGRGAAQYLNRFSSPSSRS
jgi:hypothetical protein